MERAARRQDRPTPLSTGRGFTDRTRKADPFPVRVGGIAILAGLAAAAVLAGCKAEGCLGDEAGCRVKPACPSLSFQACTGGFVDVRVLAPGDAIPGGPYAKATAGDLLLGNDRVVAAIDAIDRPRYLATSGGNILDLGTRGGNDDNLDQVLQSVGILPGDQARWESLEIVEAGPGVAAIQVRGTLDGRPGVKIASRYEVRPCEPGIRVRTEIVNLGDDPELWVLSDGWYWGGKATIPFVPARNEGFRHDEIDLETIGDAFREFPFLAGSVFGPPYVSYAEVACNVRTLSGFNSLTASAVGLGKRIAMPRDTAVFERFIAASPRPGVAGAADVALDVRARLFGEKNVTLRGKLVRPGGIVLPGEAKGSVVVSEVPRPGAAAEERVPWSQALPGADGTFELRLPAGRRYLVEPQAFGRPATGASVEVDVGATDVDVGALTFPLVARVTFGVSDSRGRSVDARVVLVPADAATASSTRGQLYGTFDACTPFLGAPHGPSPACNQVLVHGTAWADVPAGSYHVYATRGPFHTLGHSLLDVAADARTVNLVVDPLPLAPAGALSADLHVHSRISFDTTFPDEDRVLSLSAAGLDVIAATDHDVFGNLDAALDLAGLKGVVAVFSGIETTAEVPWFTIPGSVVPRVIGHWNFFPMAWDPTRPRNGAPWDERMEPGALFDAMRQHLAGPGGTGIVQMNHCWYASDFGRDLGWPRALEIDARRALPGRDDGSTLWTFERVPPGGRPANDAFDAMEVMNDSWNENHLQYRAVWFWLLDQGRRRAGTANSDSHGLADSIVGTPRNLVWAATTPADLDPGAFVEAVRAGRVLGTNGPVVEASIHSGGVAHLPRVDAWPIPAADAMLHVRVSAAPWVPVREVRVVVNGRVAWKGPPTVQPADPFGTADLVRLQRSFLLSELLAAVGAGTRDAWIVVEAGEPLPLSADLNGDGIPDTGDNDGNGVVDRRDVKPGEDYGPLDPPPAPSEFADPAFHFAAVSRNGLPQAFTNPFLLDRDGDGRFTGPGVGGGP